MFIKDNKNYEETENFSLRERFVKEINNSLVIIREDISKEEKLRKEILEKIKKRELGIPA